MRVQPISRAAAWAVAALLAAGCSAGSSAGSSTTSTGPTLGPTLGSTPRDTSSATSEPTSEPAAAEPGTVPPPWLGTRVLARTPDGFGVQAPTPKALQNRRFTLPDTVAPLPGTRFASRIEAPAPAAVISRSTWAPGCPVPAEDLAWVRLTFWGFDNSRHTGELLVNTDAAEDLVSVFHALYRARFPIEEMRITSKAEQTAPPTGDGNNTGAFNCRPVRGETVFSQHAYGLAVDVNPFQNPYLKGDLVLPELAGSYADRRRVRPGMILPSGPVVRAFSTIGWTWGGTWHSLKDLQHFSRSGG